MAALLRIFPLLRRGGKGLLLALLSYGERSAADTDDRLPSSSVSGFVPDAGYPEYTRGPGVGSAAQRKRGAAMYQTMSLPLYSGSFEEYHGWGDLRAELAALGCDGMEGIWSGEEFPEDLPAGYRLSPHLLSGLAGLLPG